MESLPKALSDPTTPRDIERVEHALNELDRSITNTISVPRGVTGLALLGMHDAPKDLNAPRPTRSTLKNPSIYVWYAQARLRRPTTGYFTKLIRLTAKETRHFHSRKTRKQKQALRSALRRGETFTAH